MPRIPALEPVFLNGLNWCGNCEDEEAYLTGRCQACHKYRHRNDHERPLELVELSFWKKMRKIDQERLAESLASEVGV